MDWFATLSLALGSAWTSGINLYATVSVLGLLQKFGGGGSEEATDGPVDLGKCPEEKDEERDEYDRDHDRSKHGQKCADDSDRVLGEREHPVRYGFGREVSSNARGRLCSV